MKNLKETYEEIIEDVGNGYERLDYEACEYGAWEIKCYLMDNLIIIQGETDETTFTCVFSVLNFVNMTYEDIEERIDNNIYYNTYPREDI